MRHPQQQQQGKLQQMCSAHHSSRTRKKMTRKVSGMTELEERHDDCPLQLFVDSLLDGLLDELPQDTAGSALKQRGTTSRRRLWGRMAGDNMVEWTHGIKGWLRSGTTGSRRTASE